MSSVPEQGLQGMNSGLLGYNDGFYGRLICSFIPSLLHRRRGGCEPNTTEGAAAWRDLVQRVVRGSWPSRLWLRFAVQAVILLGCRGWPRSIGPPIRGSSGRVRTGVGLAESFPPTPEEIVWARGKTQSDPHPLALVGNLVVTA